MKGVAYDVEHKVGTLFLLGDTIVGGNISIVCMGKTREKSFEAAIQTLSFVQRNYGMDMEAKYSKRCEQMNRVLLNLKRLMKLEMKENAYSGTLTSSAK